MQFIIRNASLNHLNVRKEGPKGAQAVALDIKVAGSTPWELMVRLLGATEPEKVKAAFWEPTEGDLLWSGFDSMTSWCEFTRCSAVINDMELHQVKAHKFKMLPLWPFMLSIECTLSIVKPEDVIIEKLAKLVKEHANITVTEQGLNLEGAET